MIRYSFVIITVPFSVPPHKTCFKRRYRAVEQRDDQRHEQDARKNVGIVCVIGKVTDEIAETAVRTHHFSERQQHKGRGERTAQTGEYTGHDPRQEHLP